MEQIFKRQFYFVEFNVVITFLSLFKLEGFQKACMSQTKIGDLNADVPLRNALSNSSLSLSSCLDDLASTFDQGGDVAAAAAAAAQELEESTWVCHETKVRPAYSASYIVCLFFFSSFHHYFLIATTDC